MLALERLYTEKGKKDMTKERLMAKLKDVNGCWEWQGYIHTSGYGRYYKSHGKTFLVHREMYKYVKGEIPEDLVIDHLCRNRKCANPDHMEVVTRGENVLRGTAPSAQHAKVTHCPQGHPYSGTNLAHSLNQKTGNLARVCKACRKIYDAKKHLRKKH